MEEGKSMEDIQDGSSRSQEVIDNTTNTNGRKPCLTLSSNINGIDFICTNRPTPKPRKIFYLDPKIEQSAETTAISKVSELSIDHTLTKIEHSPIQSLRRNLICKLCKIHYLRGESHFCGERLHNN